ncbi:ATPase [bacterium]|nr:ATPase [bacterium]
MEQKTQVSAENGQQDIRISRKFDLPVEALFLAYTQAEFVAQWMGTQVVKLENKNHGSYQFITTDPQGNQHGFNGTIHEVVPNKKIIRTFQMENGGFPVQLEFLDFSSIDANTSQLNIHMIFKSIEDRNRLLQMPFAKGLNFAHNRLENTMQSNQLK